MFCFNLCQDAFWISTLRPGINHGKKSTRNLCKRGPAGGYFRGCSFQYFQNLRWGCDQALGDRITCFNRHFAENFGYWLDTDFYDYAIKQVSIFCFLILPPKLKRAIPNVNLERADNFLRFCHWKTAFQSSDRKNNERISERISRSRLAKLQRRRSHLGEC